MGTHASMFVDMGIMCVQVYVCMCVHVNNVTT